MQESKRAGYLAASALALACLTYLVLLGSEEVVSFWAGKERLFELLGAFLFLAASILCFAAYRRVRPVDRVPFPARRHFYGLLAVFFFVAFGEEISWGQILLGFETPPEIAELNEQGELNLHNLTLVDSYTGSDRKSGWRSLVTSNRLFDYFMLGVFALLPAAAAWVARLRGFLASRALPVMPGILAAALFVNLALTAGAEITWGSEKLMHIAISETREFNYAYLCFIGFLILFMKEKNETEPGGGP